MYETERILMDYCRKGLLQISDFIDEQKNVKNNISSL